MATNNSDNKEKAKCMHFVNVTGKDEESAQTLLELLAGSMRDASIKSGAVWYEVGLKLGSKTELYLCDTWHKWEDLDQHLQNDVLPIIDTINALLVENFDPAKNTTRIGLP